MTRSEIEKKVVDILCQQLGVDEDQCIPTAKLDEDLGSDSLDCVELIMAFEEEFGLDISDEDSERITTVAGIVDYLVENVDVES